MDEGGKSSTVLVSLSLCPLIFLLVEGWWRTLGRPPRRFSQSTRSCEPSSTPSSPLYTSHSPSLIGSPVLTLAIRPLALTYLGCDPPSLHTLLFASLPLFPHPPPRGRDEGAAGGPPQTGHQAPVGPAFRTLLSTATLPAQ